MTAKIKYTDEPLGKLKVISDFLPGPMRNEANLLHSREHRGISIASRSLGALALGAIAVGALAIGALAIGKLAIGHARIRRLEIDELVVRQLHVTEELHVPPAPGVER